MYRLYLTNDKYTICSFKCTGDSMEDCYNEYGKDLVENGLKQGYSIQSQKEKYNLFISAINKRKENCYKIRASDLFMYLACYCSLYKFNEMDDNHFFLKLK